MSCQVFSAIISFLFHIVVVVSIVQLGSLIPSSQNPLVIDFSIEKVIPPVSESQQSVEASAIRSLNTFTKKKIVKKKKLAKKVKPVLKKNELMNPVLPAKQEEKALTQTESEVSLPQKKPEILEDQYLPEETIKENNIHAASREKPENPPETLSRIDDSGVVTADQQEYARSQYIKEHFKYISRIVQKNISYPYIAKKMLWEGKVTISFIINIDGSVQDICIEQSSGFDILDKNAKETVKSTSPSPPQLLKQKS